MMTETIPQMLWSATPDGAVDYCSQHVLDYTGMPVEELVGSGWMKAVHPEDAPAMAETWMSCVSNGTPYQFEFRGLRAADRVYRWCVSSALPLRSRDDRILAWYGTVVDLHDWKQTQETLRKTQTELARAARLMTMGELTASIAHEINQPLAAVITNANACSRLLASESPDVAEVREAVSDIAEAGTRASAAISRIRALLKNSPPEKIQLDVNGLIRETLAVAKSELQRHAVSAHENLSTSLPAARGDRVQLQQVVLNLIMNAAGPAGARHLHVESGKDEVGNVVVAIGDTGPGFPPGDAERIFDAFFSTKTGGLGMGLSISRSIVDAHGGRLWADPVKGSGATFRFTIPRDA